MCESPAAHTAAPDMNVSVRGNNCGWRCRTSPPALRPTGTPFENRGYLEMQEPMESNMLGGIVCGAFLSTTFYRGAKQGDLLKRERRMFSVVQHASAANGNMIGWCAVQQDGLGDISKSQPSHPRHRGALCQRARRREIPPPVSSLIIQQPK